jgi:hypothetical protein
MQFLTLSRRRTDQFPPEAFTAELAAHEGQRVKALYASASCGRSGRGATFPELP